MITAIRKVHLAKGPWVTNGGYEYNLTLIAAMLALTEAGPGRPSVDAAAFPRLKGNGLALAAVRRLRRRRDAADRRAHEPAEPRGRRRRASARRGAAPRGRSASRARTAEVPEAYGLGTARHTPGREVPALGRRRAARADTRPIMRHRPNPRPQRPPDSRPRSCRSSLEVCPACGTDFVNPVEWTAIEDHSWWMHLRCAQCEHSREVTVSNAEAERFDEALDSPRRPDRPRRAQARPRAHGGQGRERDRRAPARPHRPRGLRALM